MKRLILFGAVCLFSICSYGQDPAQRIIAPSPDAAALGKYGAIPVNLYNGLPDIKIPLFEIKARDADIPLVLSYHATGIRVEEEAGWTGLGWSLMAGGVITRTVNGNDDFLHSVNHNYKGYIYSKNTEFRDNDPEILNHYLNDVCQGLMDPQPDIFYFNFSGYSGIFYIVQKNDPAEPVQVRLLSPVKMKFSYNEDSDTWEVRTADGSRYIFAEKEYTENWTGSGGSEMEARSSLVSPSIQIAKDQKFISSWYLTKIISALDEPVSLSYKHANPKGYEFVSRSVVNVSETKIQCIGFGRLISKQGCLADSPYENYGIIPMKPGYNSVIDLSCAFSSLGDWTFNSSWLSGPPQNFDKCDMTHSFSASMQVYFQPYLSEIDFASGHINFQTADREDLEGLARDSRYPDRILAGPQLLEQITLYDRNNRVVKAIEFNYSYFNENQDTEPFRYKRLKLLSLIARSGDQEIPPYLFGYNESISLPAKDSRSRDHWGFFNHASNDETGPAAQPTLIPAFSLITFAQTAERTDGADREPDEKYTGAALLKKITYPTGGSTEFEFENHSFNLDQSAENMPFRNFQLSALNENQVFDLKYPAEIVFHINIRCTTAACYQGGTIIPCEPPDYNEPYFILKNLVTDKEELREIYADYACIYGYETGDCSGKNIEVLGNGSSPCGIYRRVVLVLKPGKYLIETFPENDLEIKIAAAYQQPQPVTMNTVSRVVRGGGVRIKSITDHDGLDPKNDRVKTFLYEFPDEKGTMRSAGKLMSFPKYIYAEYYISRELDNSKVLLIKLRSHSSSNIPLGTSAQSSAVGYDRVEERIGINAQGGYTDYYYINEPDAEPEPFFPNIPSMTHAYKNGLVIRQADYDKNHFKAREVTQEYGAVNLGNVTGLALLNYHCGSNEMFLFDHYNYVFRQYVLPSEWWYIQSTAEKVYDLEDQSNERCLVYQTKFKYNEDHKLVTRSEFTGSQGRQIIEIFYYPLDAREIAPPEMWDETNPNYKHIHDKLIRKVTLVSDGQSQVKTYEKADYFRYDPASQKILLDHTDVAENGNNPELRARYTRYDTWGNVLEYVNYESKDFPGQITTFLWSTDGLYLVAKIENASYDEVSQAAEKCKLESFGITSLADDQLLRNNLGLIREQLPSAQMYIYTIQPLTGITSITDPNGKTTYFEYDVFQRLQKITDFGMNPLSDFQYQFQTATQDHP